LPNCDNCGASLRIDRDRGVFICGHCGSEQDTPAALAHIELLDETSDPCPICATPLSASRLDGYSLLCCAQCFGMLIPMNQFAAVIDALRARETRTFRTARPRRQDPAGRVIECPSCAQPMHGHIYGGPGNVVIDSCEHCQVNWLDAGELRQIAIAPDG
jgi:Zn-finger nucleic acid-binding protein